MKNIKEPSRILIVDDNHQIVVVVSLMLETLGYQADSANCGTAALGCLDKYDYDLVLTDFDMPDMKGDALAFKIRERWPCTGVVIMTGGNNEEIETSIENGLAEHLILKPFSKRDLETAMSKAFRPDFNRVAC